MASSENELMRATQINRMLILIVFLLMIVLFGGAFFKTAPVPRWITVENISVVNDEGDEVLRIGYNSHGGKMTVHNPEGVIANAIGVSKKGHGWIATYENGGKRTVYVGHMDVGKGEGGVCTFRSDGSEATILGPWGDGWSGVATMGLGDELTAYLGRAPKGGGIMCLYTQAGKCLVDVGTNELGGGALWMYNAKEKSSMILSSIDSGDGYLAISGENGNPLIELSSTVSGDAYLAAYRKSGELLAMIDVNDDLGSFSLHNSKGKAVATLGMSKKQHGNVSIGNKGGEELIGLHVNSNGEAAQIESERLSPVLSADSEEEPK